MLADGTLRETRIVRQQTHIHQIPCRMIFQRTALARLHALKYFPALFVNIGHRYLERLVLGRPAIADYHLIIPIGINGIIYIPDYCSLEIFQVLRYFFYFHRLTNRQHAITIGKTGTLRNHHQQSLPALQAVCVHQLFQHGKG